MAGMITREVYACEFWGRGASERGRGTKFFWPFCSSPGRTMLAWHRGHRGREPARHTVRRHAQNRLF